MSATATSPLTGSGRHELRLGDLVQFARRTLEGVGRESTAVITLPAPIAPPERLLRGAGELGVLWDPPHGAGFAGIGRAARIGLAGPERFNDLRRRASEVADTLVSYVHPAVEEVPEPRFIGGFAFDVGSANAEPWDEFGDGCFTLPRWSYVTGDTASLSLAVPGAQAADEAARERLLTQLQATLTDLDRETGRSSRPAGVRAVEPPDIGQWTAEVEAIRSVLKDGAFRKIVAARPSLVRLAGGLDAAAFLARLSRGLRDSTRFAFCRERSTFLGATPERLIRLRGKRFETEALAGSIAAGDAQAELLLSSLKDRHEYELVVDSVVRRLQPLADELDVAPEPQIRELREVLHLHNPISGRLREAHHVLDLVETLHPTPAVGGVPTEAAMRWIAEHEPAARGWYAAPVGWFDARGDGEFWVALRACLVREEVAHLYAGAGIVEDSDPELEYREIELKKKVILAALGATD